MDFRLTGQPRIEPLAGPIPKLKVAIGVQAIRSDPSESGFHLFDLIARFDLLGITIPQVVEESGLQIGDDLAILGNRELRYLLVLPRDLISQIEAVRVDDVTVSLSLQARYLRKMQPGQGAVPVIPSVFGVGHSFDISESKWLGLLDKMGYFSSWLLEIPRPKIEGWDQVVGFLKKAEERILAHDAEGAIGQCRAAWKSVQPLAEANLSDIAAEIDRGSKKEEDEPEKSKRVEALWRGALKFSNTGSHPEYYAATMSDAMLAYQITCSLLAYLSRKQVEVQKHEQA